MKWISLGLAALMVTATVRAEDSATWVRYEGGEGPGQGKHIVLVSGDEEYRSEEALPHLGRILAKHHGFTCTVLFAVNPETGEIDPNNRANIPGLEALAEADLMIIATRFRELQDEQMAHIDAYVNSGRPIIGLRTATHAFNTKADSKYAHYNWRSKAEGWEGGFGRRILGETWINHHGQHGKQATRGMLVDEKKDHPILNGIADGEIFGPTDVYGVRLPLPGDSQPLVLGQVVAGMNPEDPAAEGPKNNPMMPVAWIKTYEGAEGKTGRVFTTTMGASQDLANEAFRRLLVNASFWAVGLEDKTPEKAQVDLVGEFEPTRFSFGGFQKGVRPADYALD